MVSKAGKRDVVRSPDARMFRGGLKSPRIFQEGLNEATILSLVATGLGVDGSWERLVGGAQKCRHHVCGRLEPATAAGSRLEKRPYLSIARSSYGEVQRLPDVRAVTNG
jgi:hypothetical protein